MRAQRVSSNAVTGSCRLTLTARADSINVVLQTPRRGLVAVMAELQGSIHVRLTQADSAPDRLSGARLRTEALPFRRSKDWGKCSDLTINNMSAPSDLDVIMVDVGVALEEGYIFTRNSPNLMFAYIGKTEHFLRLASWRKIWKPHRGVHIAGLKAGCSARRTPMLLK